MVKLTVVEKCLVPVDALITAGAVMPRVFCVITGEKANVYRGKKCIRKFQHSENGVLKRDKVQKSEKIIAAKVLMRIRKPICEGVS